MSTTVYQLIKKDTGWSLRCINKNDLFDSVEDAAAEGVKHFKAQEEKQELEEHSFEPVTKDDKDDRLNDVILLG